MAERPEAGRKDPSRARLELRQGLMVPGFVRSMARGARGLIRTSLRVVGLELDVRASITTKNPLAPRAQPNNRIPGDGIVRGR